MGSAFNTRWPSSILQVTSTVISKRTRKSPIRLMHFSKTKIQFKLTWSYSSWIPPLTLCHLCRFAYTARSPFDVVNLSWCLYFYHVVHFSPVGSRKRNSSSSCTWDEVSNMAPNSLNPMNVSAETRISTVASFSTFIDILGWPFSGVFSGIQVPSSPFFPRSIRKWQGKPRASYSQLTVMDDSDDLSFLGVWQTDGIEIVNPVGESNNRLMFFFTSSPYW